MSATRPAFLPYLAGEENHQNYFQENGKSPCFWWRSFTKSPVLILRFVYVAFLLTLTLAPVAGQGIIDKIIDLMEFNLGPVPADSTHFQPKVVFAPIAYFQPNTSLGFGFGATLLFKPKGAGPDTRTSNVPLGISYTLKNQIFASTSYTIFFPEERWLLRGNLDYLDFPQEYYGVGNGTRDEDLLDITYQQFLIEPLLLRQVVTGLFVGGGFRYNTYYNTELVEAKEGLPAGFDLQDSLGSKSVGLEFAASYDTRDNLVNAERGVLAEFTHGFYGTALGGSAAFQLSKLDTRTYRRLGPKSVLAGQFYARFATDGTPVQELSNLGGDERLRGFQEFRFRDRFALFGQFEYRWQTFENIGLVFFGGTGQVAASGKELGLDQLRYSLGTGLRVTVIPQENVNLRVDYGYGFGLSSGSAFYIGLGEAF